MEKTLNIACIYGVIAALSFLLACGYCAFVRKKEIWLICLYIFQFLLPTWDILHFLFQNHWGKRYLPTEWHICEKPDNIVY